MTQVLGNILIKIEMEFGMEILIFILHLILSRGRHTCNLNNTNIFLAVLILLCYFLKYKHTMKNTIFFQYIHNYGNVAK